MNNNTNIFINTLLRMYSKTMKIQRDNESTAAGYIKYCIPPRIYINEKYIENIIDSNYEEFNEISIKNKLDYRMIPRKYVYGGVVLHELFHLKHTYPLNELKEKITGLPYPNEYLIYLLNVVEDCTIQRIGQYDSPTIVKTCFNVTVPVLQGKNAAIQYMQMNNNTIKDKLFYFIVLYYSQSSKEILEKLENYASNIGFSDDILYSFKEAVSINNPYERAMYTLDVFAPLVYQSFVKKVTDEIIEQSKTTGSILDAENIIESDNKNKTNDSDDTDDSEGTDDSDCTEETDGTGGTGGSEGTDGTESTDEECTDESNESHKDNTDKQDDAKTNAEENKSKSNGNTDVKSNVESDESTDKKSDKNSKETNDLNKPTKSDEETISIDEAYYQEKINEAIENIDKEIKEAAEELNKNQSMDTSALDKYNKNIQKAIEESNSYEIESQLNSDIVDISKIVEQKYLNEYCNYEYANGESKINQIYNNATLELEPIYNSGNKLERYLDEGEVDSEDIISYYTENNPHIHHQIEEYKNDKDIKVITILDCSTSMFSYDLRFYYSCICLAGLFQAFTNVGIDFTNVAFSDETVITVPFGTVVTNSKEIFAKLYSSPCLANIPSCTYMAPSLKYVLNSAEFNQTSFKTCKLCLIFTDGDTYDKDTCIELVNKIVEEDVIVIAFYITNETILSKDNMFEKIFRNVPYYIVNAEDMLTVVPQMIYKYIIEKFMLK